jgi:rRNA maturation endonuclease Nob1
MDDIKREDIKADMDAERAYRYRMIHFGRCVGCETILSKNDYVRGECGQCGRMIEE